MKFSLLYSVTHFYTNRKQYAVVIFMMTLSMLLIGAVQYLRVSTSFRLETCEEILAADSNQVLFVYTKGRQFASVPKCDLDEVSSFGTYYEDVIRIKGVSVNSICVSQELSNLVKLRVTEGSLPGSSSIESNCLLIGFDVRVASVGDEIVWVSSSGETCKGVVYGRLIPESQWLLGANSFRGKIRETKTSLDKKILCISKEMKMPNDSYVFVTDKNDINTTQQVYSFIENLHIPVVSGAYLSDIFAVADIENKGVVRALGEIVWLVMIVTVVLMSCLQTVIALNHRRLIGIWYANGVTRAQAISVFAISLLFSTLIAIGISVMALGIFYKLYGGDGLPIMREIIKSRVVARVILSILIMDIIGFVLPLRTLLICHPRELLQAYRK